MPDTSDVTVSLSASANIPPAVPAPQVVATPAEDTPAFWKPYTTQAVAFAATYLTGILVARGLLHAGDGAIVASSPVVGIAAAAAASGLAAAAKRLGL